MTDATTISAIILTVNAEKNIELLLNALKNQTVKPHEIIVADSESTDKTVSIARELGAMVLTIKRSEFNHGGTRDYAFKKSKGDYVLFLTHDAVPANGVLIEKLIEKMESSPKIAVVYGRQLPREDATYMERLVRNYNYPVEEYVYDSTDISKHGIKTFFMSDVCALYRRDVYEKIGGFENGIKTNEDMFYAANAIHNGYSVGYAANAEVIHSHNFSLTEQYQRNYIQGYEIERHKMLLSAPSGEYVSQNSEGIKLVKIVSKKMLSKGRVLSWMHFGFDCCARYLGSYMGKRKARKDGWMDGTEGLCR